MGSGIYMGWALSIYGHSHLGSDPKGIGGAERKEMIHSIIVAVIRHDIDITATIMDGSTDALLLIVGRVVRYAHSSIDESIESPYIYLGPHPPRIDIGAGPI